MNTHRGFQVSVCTATAMMLSSCVIKDGSLDFTWWTDAAAPIMEDDVIIESGSGQQYQSSPAPVQIPTASVPQQEPVQPATPQTEPEQALPPLLPIPSVSDQQQPAVAAPVTYTVKPGDTLSAIARRHKTTVKTLVMANGMANANIPLQINQQLIIPTGGAPQQPRAYKPATRPTQPAPAVKASSPGVHTVQPGDTLFGIARKYAINPSQLMKANGLTPETANKIHVGAKLRLPSAN